MEDRGRWVAVVPYGGADCSHQGTLHTHAHSAHNRLAQTGARCQTNPDRRFASLYVEGVLVWQGNSCISKFPHVRFEVLDGGDVEALKAPRISFIRSGSARSHDPSRARGAQSRGPDPGAPLSPGTLVEPRCC